MQAGQHFVCGRNNANLADLLLQILGRVTRLQSREGVYDAKERAGEKETIQLKVGTGFWLEGSGGRLRFGYFLLFPTMHRKALQNSDYNSNFQEMSTTHFNSFTWKFTLR